MSGSAKVKSSSATTGDAPLWKITESHKFVSFLAKYSTRDPGVCLDEVAIAIGYRGMTGGHGGPPRARSS
jgi:hypothetical protein